MSQVKVSGNASGTGVFEIAAPNTNTNYTLTLPESTGALVSTNATQTLTNKTIQGGAITSGTAVTVSGTSVDIAGIPSWAKRVTLMFNGVSTNSTWGIEIRLGAASVVATGYNASCGYASTAGTYNYSTTGFPIDVTNTATAAMVRTGAFTFSLIGSNTWVLAGAWGSTTAQIGLTCAGSSPDLGGALTTVRITTTLGTPVFDAGSINILYE